MLRDRFAKKQPVPLSDYGKLGEAVRFTPRTQQRALLAEKERQARERHGKQLVAPVPGRRDIVSVEMALRERKGIVPQMHKVAVSPDTGATSCSPTPRVTLTEEEEASQAGWPGWPGWPGWHWVALRGWVAKY